MHINQFIIIVNQSILFSEANPLKGVGEFISVFLTFGGLLVFWILQAIICNSLITVLESIPEQYHRTSSAKICFLAIPFLNVFGNFFVFPGIARSLKAFAKTQKNYQRKDFGEILAWVCCCSFLCFSALLCSLPMMSFFERVFSPLIKRAFSPFMSSFLVIALLIIMVFSFFISIIALYNFLVKIHTIVKQLQVGSASVMAKDTESEIMPNEDILLDIESNSINRGNDLL